MTLSLTVQSLEVILAISLSMEAQIIAIVRLAFYHLWLVRQLTPNLSSCKLATVIQTLLLQLQPGTNCSDVPADCNVSAGVNSVHAMPIALVVS